MSTTLPPSLVPGAASVSPRENVMGAAPKGNPGATGTSITCPRCHGDGWLSWDDAGLEFWPQVQPENYEYGYRPSFGCRVCEGAGRVG